MYGRQGYARLDNLPKVGISSIPAKREFADFLTVTSGQGATGCGKGCGNFANTVGNGTKGLYTWEVFRVIAEEGLMWGVAK